MYVQNFKAEGKTQPMSLFNQYLTIHTNESVTSNPNLVRKIQAFRHEVYCEKLGFEQANVLGLETDEFDLTSMHFAVTCNLTGKVIGCCRLVPQSKQATLPLDASLGGKSERNIHSSGPGSLAMELSRFAVDYRRHSSNHLPEQHTKQFNLAANMTRYVLTMAVIEFAIENKIDDVFLLTEPRFIATMKLAGLPISEFGEPVEYRGVRQAAVLKATQIAKNIPEPFRLAKMLLTESRKPATSHQASV